MKRANTLLASILIIGLGLLVVSAGLAAENPEGKARQDNAPMRELQPAAASDVKAEAPKSTGDMPVYKPPLRSAPGGRIGGGTRGGEGRQPEVFALVPDHLGLTTREQPSLYWFLSKPTNYVIEFVLTEPKSPKPLVEARIHPAPSPGVQRIRLADYGIHLKNGGQYQWFIALVANPEQRSKDIVTGGDILRVDLPTDVRARLDREAKEKAPFIYAEEGFWYDALEAISDLIISAPGDAAFQKQRAALLNQVGLLSVADYEMKR